MFIFIDLALLHLIPFFDGQDISREHFPYFCRAKKSNVRPLLRHIKAFLFPAFFTLPALATTQPVFINIGEERGLSSLQVTDLYQDKFGFVWIGTPHGLNRLDGYGCVQYFNQPGDTTSISSSHISPRAFAEDPAGNLWVATFRGGLNYFRRDTERFKRYQTQSGRSGGPSMDKLFAVEPDSKGGLWIATAGRGINYFDPDSHSFRVWDATDQNPNLLMSSTMTGCLKVDRDGQLWIGTNKGACRFDPGKETFEYFPFVPNFDRSPSDWFVATITEDRQGTIWLGTAHGLNRWDAGKGIFVKYFFAQYFPEKDPAYDYILDILHDDDGSLWLGTNAGLLHFDPAGGAVVRFQHEPDNPFSIRKGPVNTLLKDRDGHIWAGTNNGISILNNAGGKLRHDRFLPLQDVFKSITQSEGINAVMEVNGALWLATQTGVYRYRPGEPLHRVSDGNFSALFFDKTKSEVYAGTTGDGYSVFDAGKLNRIRHVPKTGIGQDTDPYTVKGHRINSFVIDGQGYLWIAADGCLNRYNPATGRFRKFQDKQKKLGNPSGNTNQHLLLDRRGNLWIASMGGLSKLPATELAKPFDDADLRFEHFLYRPGDSQSISSDVVFCLLEDSNGHIWAGTDAGLNRYDPEASGLGAQTGVWRWFFNKVGLPRNEIVTLAEDHNGDIWAGSPQEGLAKFNRATGRFARYSKKDGLLTDRFRPNAGICTTDGFVVLGGRSGLVGFHPDSLLQRSTAPPLYFTDYKILNQEVPIGDGDNQLAAAMYQTGQIAVDYDRKVLSFQFAALNFIHPEKQVYRFRLNPFHREWQYNGNKREITFTNLDPGTYQLQVETSENGYDWTGKSLTLRVRPPWYRTWWAYLFYTVAALALLLGIRRFEIRRHLAHAEARRLQELDQVKTRLYTNITHEFRTPLTVILGEAAQLEKQVEGKQKGGLAAIRRQGRHLLNLVNQMLDLAKVEAGSLHLNLIQGNIILFLKYLLESFHSLADSKQIGLRFESDTTEFWMDYDPDKIQKIVSNLLSNAIKFTPHNGQVTLHVKTGRELILQVSDTGQGIQPDKLPFVFDRFYQADHSASRQAEGTGIGLTLAKELSRLLGGQIGAESRLGEGATFTVTFPVTRAADRQPFQPESFFNESLEEKPGPEIASAALPIDKPMLPAGRPRLLLVEDNADVARYIGALLAADYQVLKVQNGKAGVEAAFRLVPDIVVSDVMMPEMDGFDLCRILKSDERTSHIPIVLLTAKADHASKIEGLTRGADVYLPKPFDPGELLLRLKKLIELRRHLQERYAGSAGVLKTDKPDASDPEAQFLQKVVRIVEAYIGDENFDMPQLCKALNMSRTNLFRKLKALTGKSATDFIRQLRLEKAKALLETTDMNVTEVSYAVGFGSPNYFSRVFQEAFGVAPGRVKKGILKS